MSNDNETPLTEAEMRAFFMDPLERGAGPVGAFLARWVERGSLLSCGHRELDESGKRTGRRWIVALATNDAADHLDRWVDEQNAIRRTAAVNAGHTFSAADVHEIKRGPT